MRGDALRNALERQPAFFEQPTRGVIAADVANMSDGAHFTVPGFTGDLRFGPCRWQARDATSKPIKGNECLVIMDSHGDLWITAWWPYGQVG
jgi:hypothetical protein